MKSKEYLLKVRKMNAHGVYHVTNAQAKKYAELFAKEKLEEVNNLDIPVVVGQSEQLVCDFCNKDYHESRIFNICDDCKQSMP